MAFKFNYAAAITASLFLLSLGFLAYNHTQTGSIISRSQVAAIAGAGSGLAAHYEFEEGSGSSVDDSSGNGNSGTMADGTEWTSGVIGSGAVSFDGTDDQITVPDSASLSPTASVTMSAWFKTTATMSTGSKRIVGKPNAYTLSLAQGSSNRNLNVSVRGGLATFSYSASAADAYNDGEWHHLVGIYDGDLFHIYLDGALVASEDTAATKIDDTNTDLIIGSAGGSSYFPGAIDDVRIYSRALSSDEVSELYELGAPDSGSSPVNGVCGETKNSCSAGTFEDETDSSTNYLWSCAGSDGGSDSSCSLAIPDDSEPSEDPTDPDIRTPAPPPVSWTAPIGIPEPSFGIRETHFMYQLQDGETCSTNPEKCYDFGNGLEPYRDAGSGPYTHYVDRSDPAATDSSNPYGSPEKPRKTLPKPTGDGAVIEIHGEYTTGHGHYVFTGGGSESRPMFFRGVSEDDMPVINGLNFYISGSYVIVENIEFIDTAPHARPGTLPTNREVPVHHFVVRHSLIHGENHRGIGAASYIDDNPVHDFVFYDNNIYRDGYDPMVPHPENDQSAVSISKNGYNVWILDNNLHHVPGDSVGAGHAANYTAYNYYIGRNLMHDNGEDAVDLKEVENVVVSQNKMYNFFGASGGSGAANGGSGGVGGGAIVVHYGPTHSPKNVWLIFNEIYNTHGGAFQAGGDQIHDVHFIGNTIRDIQNIEKSGKAYNTWSSRNVYIVNNTIHNVDNGIFSTVSSSGSNLHLHNNIITNLTSGGTHLSISGSTLTNAKESGTISNNIFYQPGGSVVVNGGSLASFKSSSQLACVECVETDPMLVDIDNDDVRLESDSPAIDGSNMTIVNELVSKFQTHFGLDISRDITGSQRGAIWDIGAYEYGSSGGGNGGDDDDSPSDTSAPIISSVAVSSITSSGAVISWSTSESADTQIEYGLTTSYGNSTTLLTSLSTFHSQTLTNLQPNTVYYYKVKSKDAAGNLRTSTGSFTTVQATAGSDSGASSGGSTTSSGGGGGSSGASAASGSAQQTAAGEQADITPAAAEYCGTTFVRTLSIGSVGQDVRALQVFLNAIGFTVSVSGPGSAGNETTYYGSATANAVTRYQEANAAETLAPVGLSRGTGIFGQMSMRSVNSRAGAACGSSVATPQPTAVSGRFTQPLNLGSVGSEVSLLQTYLATLPDIYPAGLVTGYFGPLTGRAVQLFQQMYQIAHPGEEGYGHVGPRTRAKLNELLES